VDIIINGPFEGICVEFEQNNKNNIGFPTFK